MPPLFFNGITVLSLILLVAGIGLLVLELFHPGFGAPGVLGILVLVLDIFVSARTFQQGLLMAAIVAVIVLAFLALGARLISKGKIPRKLILTDESDRESGFISSQDMQALLGLAGTALTVLRPAGMAELDGQRWDVVTQGEFIPRGAALRVVEVEGGRIVVREEPSRAEAGDAK